MTSRSNPEELAQLIRIGQDRGWLSVRQASAFFPQHYMTVRDWVEKGYMRSIPVGTRKVVTLDEIERFKKEGNWKGDEAPSEPVPRVAESQEANGAGGVNPPPVATLGNYNPDDQ